MLAYVSVSSIRGACGQGALCSIPAYSSAYSRDALCAILFALLLDRNVAALRGLLSWRHARQQCALPAPAFFPPALGCIPPMSDCLAPGDRHGLFLAFAANVPHAGVCWRQASPDIPAAAWMLVLSAAGGLRGIPCAIRYGILCCKIVFLHARETLLRRSDRVAR